MIEGNNEGSNEGNNCSQGNTDNLAKEIIQRNCKRGVGAKHVVMKFLPSRRN